MVSISQELHHAEKLPVDEYTFYGITSMPESAATTMTYTPFFLPSAFPDELIQPPHVHSDAFYGRLQALRLCRISGDGLQQPRLSLAHNGNSCSQFRILGVDREGLK